MFKLFVIAAIFGLAAAAPQPGLIAAPVAIAPVAVAHSVSSHGSVVHHPSPAVAVHAVHAPVVARVAHPVAIAHPVVPAVAVHHAPVVAAVRTHHVVPQHIVAVHH